MAQTPMKVANDFLTVRYDNSEAKTFNANSHSYLTLSKIGNDDLTEYVPVGTIELFTGNDALCHVATEKNGNDYRLYAMNTTSNSITVNAHTAYIKINFTKR